MKNVDEIIPHRGIIKKKKHTLILTPGKSIRNDPTTPLIAPDAPNAGMPRFSNPMKNIIAECVNDAIKPENKYNIRYFTEPIYDSTALPNT